MYQRLILQTVFSKSLPSANKRRKKNMYFNLVKCHNYLAVASRSSLVNADSDRPILPTVICFYLLACLPGMSQKVFPAFFFLVGVMFWAIFYKSLQPMCNINISNINFSMHLQHTLDPVHGFGDPGESPKIMLRYSVDRKAVLHKAPCTRICTQINT